MTWKEKFVALLGAEFLGNEVSRYLWALLVFLLALAALYLLRDIIFVRLKKLAEKTETDLDDTLIELIRKVRAPEYQLLAFYIATRSLVRAPLFNGGLRLLILLVFTYRAVTILQRLLDYWVNKVSAGRGLSETAKASVAQSLQVIFHATVWVAAALFLLANMGVNVSAFLTGLGIGGVAVALAAQAILGDLFNFFVILLDKPFIVGDFITADAVSGTVEHIGLKSVRLRSMSGEMIVVSNSKLLSGGLNNYRHMKRRRVVFRTSVVYQTPAEKLERIPGILKTAAEKAGKTSFDRAHLCALGESSIDFETVYYVESPDYAVYMDSQERVLRAVLEAFAKEGVEFAYPTRTVHVNGRAAD